MPRVSDMFPSSYLKATDFEEDTTLTIQAIQSEKIGDDDKYVVYFEEVDKGLVLNKTNSETIASVAGSDDTDDWAGHKITLFATTVSFQGKPTEAIRVKLRKPKLGGKPAGKPATPQRKSAQTDPDAVTDDDIPF